jgi:seryl-tRNA synthetase
MDPRVKNVTPEDLQKQFELASQVREANQDLHTAVNQIRTMRTELKAIQARFEDDPKLKALVEQAGALDKKMAPVEEELIQVNMKGSEANLAFPNMLNEQLDSLASIVQDGDSAPSVQQYDVFKMLRARLDQQLAAWKQIVSTEVPAFNQLVHNSDVPALYLPRTGD